MKTNSHIHTVLQKLEYHKCCFWGVVETITIFTSLFLKAHSFFIDNEMLFTTLDDGFSLKTCNFLNFYLRQQNIFCKFREAYYSKICGKILDHGVSIN